MNVPRWVPSLLLATVLGVGITAVPVQAEAIPSINPLCWISDQRNPAVKKNCQGHDLSWPHRGGGSNYDGPERGCGNGPIVGDTYILSNNERAWFNYPGFTVHSAQVTTELVLVKSVHYDVRFWPDYVVYTWQAQSTYQVVYLYNRPQGGWTTQYYTYKGGKQSVTCNMKGRVK